MKQQSAAQREEFKDLFSISGKKKVFKLLKQPLVTTKKKYSVDFHIVSVTRRLLHMIRLIDSSCFKLKCMRILTKQLK